jgi:hypothetical protein
VVHGGGWGIGTFREKLLEIEAEGFSLDVVCYSSTDAVDGVAGRRYFMDDPSWRTWHRNSAGEHTFPPFGQVNPGSSAVSFSNQTQCHGLHRVIRQAQGIVSKPGAGTLIDSFAAATPLVMLEPFGPHEERNSEIWAAYGFGVRYQDWINAHQPLSMLERMHENLLTRRSSAKDYPREFANTALRSH